MWNKLISIKYVGNFLILFKWLLKGLVGSISVILIIGLVGILVYFFVPAKGGLRVAVNIIWYICYGIYCLFVFGFFADGNNYTGDVIGWTNDYVGHDYEGYKISTLLISLSFPYWIIPVASGKFFIYLINKAEEERKEVEMELRIRAREEQVNKSKEGSLSRHE